MFSLIRRWFGSHASHVRANIQQRGSKRSVTTRRLRPAEQLEDRRLMAVISTELTEHDTASAYPQDRNGIYSFSWGMRGGDAESTSITGRATTPGPDDMPQLSTLERAVDPNNPNYNPFITIDYLGNGFALENCDFPGDYVQRFDGVDKPFLRFKFETVFTTKIDWSGPGDEGPEESITFVYGKLGVEYSNANYSSYRFVFPVQPGDEGPEESITFVYGKLGAVMGGDDGGSLAAVDAFIWFKDTSGLAAIDAIFAQEATNPTGLFIAASR